MGDIVKHRQHDQAQTAQHGEKEGPMGAVFVDISLVLDVLVEREIEKKHCGNAASDEQWLEFLSCNIRNESVRVLALVPVTLSLAGDSRYILARLHHAVSRFPSHNPMAQHGQKHSYSRLDQRSMTATGTLTQPCGRGYGWETPIGGGHYV